MSLLVLCNIFATPGTKIVLFYLKVLFDLLINFKGLLLVWKKLLLSHHSYKEEWVGHEPDFLVSQKIAAGPLLVFFPKKLG